MKLSVIQSMNKEGERGDYAYNFLVEFHFNFVLFNERIN